MVISSRPSRRKRSTGSRSTSQVHRLPVSRSSRREDIGLFSRNYEHPDEPPVTPPSSVRTENNKPPPDDGEPSRTAGVPIPQGSCSSTTTSRTSCVVVLFRRDQNGAGGLVRAYTESDGGSLEKARFYTKKSRGLPHNLFLQGDRHDRSPLHAKRSNHRKNVFGKRHLHALF